MSFSTLKPTLLSAQRLEQDYLSKRQTVALERLKEIQSDTAKIMVKGMLDKLVLECQSVQGFLSETIIQLLLNLKRQL